MVSQKLLPVWLTLRQNSLYLRVELKRALSVGHGFFGIIRTNNANVDSRLPGKADVTRQPEFLSQ
ncbi:hypothetical protein EFR88_08070 [Levilactobacillus brevis]|nr:hypothetical protein [Levilactobacillus brevis]